MSDNRKTWVCLLCLIAAAAGVFGYSAAGDFVHWDDPDLVLQNPLLNPPSLHHLYVIWTQPTEKLYTPLPYTAWSIICRSGGPPSPLPFHLLNIALHAASCCFVFLLLRELLEHFAAALIGALFFAVHPLQVEPVAWISGMNGVMAGVLSFAALWQYVVHAKTRRRGPLVYAAICFAAALLSKPTAVVVPLIAGVIEALILRRPLKRWAGPIAVAGAMSVVMATVAQRAQPAAHLAAPDVPDRLLVAADAAGFYLEKLIIPFDLTIDYGRTPARVLCRKVSAWPSYFIIAGVLLGIFGGTYGLPAALIFLAGLLPVLGLIPFEFQTYSTVADRYMYVPLFGAALFVAAAARFLPRWLAAALLVLLAVRCVDQTTYWHDTPALAAHQLALDPASPTGHKIYAAWLIAHHEPAAAEEHFLAALSSPEAANNIGVIRYDYANLLLRTRRYTQAAEQFRQALAALPASLRPNAHNNLGEALYYTGDVAGARGEFQAALDEQPGFALAAKNLKVLDEK